MTCRSSCSSARRPNGWSRPTRSCGDVEHCATVGRSSRSALRRTGTTAQRRAARRTCASPTRRRACPRSTRSSPALAVRLCDGGGSASTRCLPSAHRVSGALSRGRRQTSRWFVSSQPPGRRHQSGSLHLAVGRTGRPPGEVVALQWEDIDLDADVVQQPPGQRIDQRTLRTEEEAFDVGVQFRGSIRTGCGWSAGSSAGEICATTGGCGRSSAATRSSPSGRLRHRPQTGRRAWPGASVSSGFPGRRRADPRRHLTPSRCRRSWCRRCGRSSPAPAARCAPG